MRAKCAVVVLMFLLAAIAARAQTLSVSGAYGAECCAPGQIVWIEGRNFLFGVSGDASWQFRAFALGPAGESRQVQIPYVDTFRVWVFLPSSLTFPLAALRLTGPNSLDETIVIASQPPAPLLRVEGYVSHLLDPRPLGEKFSGSLTIPHEPLIVWVTFFGAGFGNTREWVVTLTGPLAGIAPATAFPASSAFGVESLQVTLPRLPAGHYMLRASAGALQTNTIMFSVE